VSNVASEKPAETNDIAPTDKLCAHLLDGCDPFGSPEWREIVELILLDTARS
jgi:hypothetical protein